MTLMTSRTSGCESLAMTVLAHVPPEPVPRSGWQCPACLTVYNPDVKACHCATKKPLSERIKKELPVQLGGPDREAPPGTIR